MPIIILIYHHDDDEKELDVCGKQLGFQGREQRLAIRRMGIAPNMPMMMMIDGDDDDDDDDVEDILLFLAATIAEVT